MTELEQYKKAYATLVGRVDNVIGGMNEISTLCTTLLTALELVRTGLHASLREAEEIFLEEDPEQ